MTQNAKAHWISLLKIEIIQAQLEKLWLTKFMRTSSSIKKKKKQKLKKRTVRYYKEMM